MTFDVNEFSGGGGLCSKDISMKNIVVKVHNYIDPDPDKSWPICYVIAGQDLSQSLYGIV